ncbi:MAG: molybdopterin cofactor-binding domain-containing protein [Polyangiaceae bacterium]
MTGRPVKLTLSREESVRMHPKRHPVTMRYTVACDATGRLTALRARMLRLRRLRQRRRQGVLERAAGHASGAYAVPNIDVEACAVYTNNPPSGACRGFGASEAQFAMEGALDLLAAKVGLTAGRCASSTPSACAGDQVCTGQLLEKSVGPSARSPSRTPIAPRARPAAP